MKRATEGDFQVHWKGDFFHGKNLAINTTNNTYLDGLGAKPRLATRDDTLQARKIVFTFGCQTIIRMADSSSSLVNPYRLWYAWDLRASVMTSSLQICGLFSCLRARVYFHPGVWHNGVYIEKKYSPATFPDTTGSSPCARLGELG